MRKFKFSHYNHSRRKSLEKMFKNLAIITLIIALGLSFMSLYLGLIVGTVGLMLLGLSRGVSLSDNILQYVEKVKVNTAEANLKSRNTGRIVKELFHNIRIHNHARAYRSASRPAFAHVSGGDDSDAGGSESDSGDPPGPSFAFSVTSFQYFYRKLNSFLFLYPQCVLNASGYWCLPFRSGEGVTL